MTHDRPDDARIEPDDASEPYPRLLVYLLAAALYITIGVFFPWVLSWWRGFVFAFIVVWALPALYRIMRRR